MSTQNPWIIRQRPNPDASLRLFCFTHAGGAAVLFRDWHAAMPPHVEVCAVESPGHMSRRREPLIRSMDALVAATVEAIDPLLDRPFAFFGYSLGALVAFHVARAARARKALQPQQLMVAASKAPHLPREQSPLSQQPQATFLSELERRYGPIDPIIKSEPELLELLLTITRADLEVLDSHTCPPQSPLSCPIFVFGGKQDGTLDASGLEAWGQHSTAATSVQWLTGGHFFIRNAGKELLGLVQAALGAQQSSPRIVHPTTQGVL